MTEKQKSNIICLRSKGIGYGKIAQTLGISLNTVKSFCRRNDNISKITVSTEIISTETTFCENCGREIQQFAKRKKKRFCSDKCRNTWWNKNLDKVKRKTVYTFTCPQCDKEFQIYGDNRRKYCSHECYIAARFKGGDSNG